MFINCSDVISESEATLTIPAYDDSQVSQAVMTKGWIQYIGKEDIKPSFLLYGLFAYTLNGSFICSIGLDCRHLKIMMISGSFYYDRVVDTFTSGYFFSIVDFSSGKFFPSKSIR
jgi:hypothetical protein